MSDTELELGKEEILDYLEKLTHELEQMGNDAPLVDAHDAAWVTDQAEKFIREAYEYITIHVTTNHGPAAYSSFNILIKKEKTTDDADLDRMLKEADSVENFEEMVEEQDGHEIVDTCTVEWAEGF